MAFEAAQAQFMKWFDEIDSVGSDLHVLYAQIRQELDQMKAQGLPLPDDLIELEARLEERFAQEKRASEAVPRPKPE